MADVKLALCLPGGGATGALYQLGALAALEDTVEGLSANAFDLYFGTSSGASVAAIMAGGPPVDRVYRALADPKDPYLTLGRRHLMRIDLSEWRRTLLTILGALRHSGATLFSGPAAPSVLVEQLDRFNDSLPAGLLSLDAYEGVLEDFFARRGVPNTFAAMPRPLRVMAHDLDTGEQVCFGRPGHEHTMVTRACIASMAMPPFFSPVRIAQRHYIDPGVGQLTHPELAADEGADVIVVVNAMVPVRVERVPTGHGEGRSVRDKGLLWVTNQALRIGMQRALRDGCARVQRRGVQSIVIEPDPEHGELFMYHPSNLEARRNILEYAYRSTRARITEWITQGHPGTSLAGWRLRSFE